MSATAPELALQMTFVQLLATTLSGGLAGALLTVVAQNAQKHWARPVLIAKFDSKEPGCVVATSAWRVVANTNQRVGDIQQQYLRLKISNCGRSSAKSVGVATHKIVHNSAGKGERHFAEEVLDLNLSLGQGNTKTDLPPKGHRFFDVAHVNTENGTADFGFDLALEPIRLSELGFVAGDYCLTVFVSAENADPVSADLWFSWSGAPSGLTIISKD